MKITIFGSGYVGLVTGACLADVGNNVLFYDNNKEKIKLLQSGTIPIYEPGLNELFTQLNQSGRVKFTTDAIEAVSFGLFQFIAVGTPPNEDGSADLRHVCAVAETIGRYMTDYKIVVNKSTVPVGMAKLVSSIIQNSLKERNLNIPFAVASNPEFLKEGEALNDFMRPDRIVIGTEDQNALNHLKMLYAPFNRNHNRIIEMSLFSAELTKYASNAMLATKISFMNEMANLAERLGADIEHVRIGMGMDPRIGFHFIYPGCGYGGSCFPKDVKALIATAQSIGQDVPLIRAVEEVNQNQKNIIFNKIKKHFNKDLSGKTFAVWGLSFKPGTDDVREAPSLVLINSLLDSGCIVRAYDPKVTKEMITNYCTNSNLQLMEKDQTISNADALIIMTEWKEFRSPDFDFIKKCLKYPIIFDGRNLYNLDYMKEKGFIYYSIGRGCYK